MSRVEQKNHAATLFIGELDAQVNEAILWELALNCGPVASVYIPRDKLTREHNNFGFVEFQNVQDAHYALQLLAGVRLFGKMLRIKHSTHAKDATNDVGANLFIGNLDQSVHEHQLREVFSKFGILIAMPKIMRDPESNVSKGFAFLNFDTRFEAADAAIEGMNNEYLGGKAITVTYALKKDSKTERHGSMAERILAANNPNRRFFKMRQDAMNKFGATPGVNNNRVVGTPQRMPPPMGMGGPPIRPPPGMVPHGMGAPPPAFGGPYGGPPGPPPGFRPPPGPPGGFRPPPGPPPGFAPPGHQPPGGFRPPPGFQQPPPGY